MIEAEVHQDQTVLSIFNQLIGPESVHFVEYGRLTFAGASIVKYRTSNQCRCSCVIAGGNCASLQSSSTNSLALLHEHKIWHISPQRERIEHKIRRITYEPTITSQHK